MRTMYDSVTAGNIPVTAQIVAGYVDGRYAWSFADLARFPNSVKVRIACFASTNAGTVLDVETGDATPAQAPGWVQRRRAAGVDPTVYCSSSWWPTVRAAFAAQGVPEPHWWIAAYPGNGSNLYAGSVAHQYADPGPYDLSVVADFWPGVDSALTPITNTLATGGTVADVPTITPLTPLTPTTVQEDDMRIFRRNSDGAVFLAAPGHVTVLNPDQYATWQNLGVHAQGMDDWPLEVVLQSLRPTAPVA